jgi:apolipoprotein N-acyltransferase
MAAGTYHKRRLVPFGEYVPLEPWLRGTIAFFDLPMSNFSRAPEDQPPITLGELRIATAICYEIVYPDLVATSAGGADLLVTVSNDTWFGASIGPHQHLQMARLRAIETGKPLLRATNDGITAVVDSRGRITASLPQFAPGILRTSVLPRTGTTPFSAHGSTPVVLLCAALLTAALAPWRRRDRRAALR